MNDVKNADVAALKNIDDAFHCDALHCQTPARGRVAYRQPPSTSRVNLSHWRNKSQVVMDSSGLEDAEVDFLVEKRNLTSCKYDIGSANYSDDLRDNEVILRICKFGFSSNNISYALIGEIMGYWKLFPANAEWGRVPVWGIAEVIKSRSSEIAEGDRFYGFFPISTLVRLTLCRQQGMFVEVSAHRRSFPAVYNRYERINARTDCEKRRRDEDLQMLLFPLFTTSYLLCDLLTTNAFFNADCVFLSSASSKTALGLACLLSRRGDRRPELIGLTSTANEAAVRASGFFDQVVCYESIEDVSRDRSVVVVDMAGNRSVVETIHRHFNEIKHSVRVGSTHWRAPPKAEKPTGPRPVRFFAPSYIEHLLAGCGDPETFQKRAHDVCADLITALGGKIDIVHHVGLDCVRRLYLDTLDGRLKPEHCHVLSWR